MPSSKRNLAQYWVSIERSLFHWLAEELGELTELQKGLIAILEVARIEEGVARTVRGTGRPLTDRGALARAFVAKAVYQFPTTRKLREALLHEVALRRICGWETAREVPSEATFSRAFAEFAESKLAEQVHAQVIAVHEAPRLVGHIARDATAIEARERVAKKPGKAEEKGAGPEGTGKKKGRSKRLQQQPGMTLPEMLADLPTACDCGTKRNSQGRQTTWVGYKLHLDVADGGIPISAILTSASVNDTQVAIPLATMTAGRVDSCYDLMDKGYDAEAIREHSRQLGHVPLIDRQRRAGKEKFEWAPHEAQRFKERTTVERIYARLKDEFGGRWIRVRGAAKVMASLMFGLLALTADQLLRVAQQRA
jgi:hypothetical protein